MVFVKDYGIVNYTNTYDYRNNFINNNTTNIAFSLDINKFILQYYGFYSGLWYSQLYYSDDPRMLKKKKRKKIKKKTA